MEEVEIVNRFVERWRELSSRRRAVTAVELARKASAMAEESNEVSSQEKDVGLPGLASVNQQLVEACDCFQDFLLALAKLDDNVFFNP